MNVGPDVNLAEPGPAANGASAVDRVQHNGTRYRHAPPRPAGGRVIPPPHQPHLSVDVGALLRPASRRWPWLIVGAILGLLGGWQLGLRLWHDTYTATAKLERYDPPLATDAYNPRPLTVPTLVHIIQSPDFFLRVGRQWDPPMSGGQVAGRLLTIAERNTEILSVVATGETPESAVKLANLYSEEVLKFAKEAQRREANEAEGYVAQHLKETEADIENARAEVPPLIDTLPAAASFDALPTPGVPDRFTAKIQSAQDELTALLARYTDAWPAVKAKRAEIAALEAQADMARRAPALSADTPAASNGSTAAASPGSGATPKAGVSREEWEVSLFHLRMLENLRTALINRQHAIAFFKENPPGNFRVEMPAALDNVDAHPVQKKIVLLTVFCGLLGLTVAGGGMLLREFFDNRLKNESDVARVTGLPVISTLGDLRHMTAAQREDWAFNTWIKLQDHLAFSPNHGLICGITSSRPGDGRSTWINLLAGAARKCGFRVLTIATKPTTVPAADEPGAAPSTAGASAARPPAASTAIASSPDAPRGFASDSTFTAMTASALFTPAEVTEKLMGPESDPLVHIPLPGWTWNLERRKQWQSALGVWRKIDNVVILVELPPASVHESVLLASNLPNILWLVQSGKSETPETRTQLETLRHARCNLVGAVINRAPTPATHGRFSRWVTCLPFLAALCLAGGQLLAGEASPPPASPREASQPAGAATFSIVNPAQRAAWQQHYTLGPGDVVTLSIYGDTDLTREEVPIGPDGRISYLEAQNVSAAGLTVDELRERLNSELGRFRREPQVFIVPVAYKSKKYFVLGKVAQRGAFTLERPITLIEAVARARGVETGLSADRSLVELADLSHAFIARRGQHLPVDFQKLFQDGDLSQNVAIEPDDYIYFPAADLKEVYVLGSVRMPGAYAYTSDVGAVGAIAARGGFTDRAWKNRLLVIRGSLGQPQTFVVNAADILGARSADLKLQPRDIVYVSDRPWARAEELLDTAAQAFVTAAVVTATGIHVDGINP
jgi:protein involved in polysaccharide export with SLBB domain/capsular polysaccharide biosynthesis protein